MTGSNNKLPPAWANHDIVSTVLDRLVKYELKDRSDKIQWTYLLLDPHAHHDTLEQHALQNLRAAALVCRSWSGPARERLYRAISFKKNTNIDRIQGILSCSRLLGDDGLPCQQLLIRHCIDDIQETQNVLLKELVAQSQRLHTLISIYASSVPSGSNLISQPSHATLTTFCLSFEVPANEWRSLYENIDRLPKTRRGITYSDFQRAMISMPNLRSLSLCFTRGTGFTQEESNKMEPIDSNKLPRFRLDYFEVYTVDYFFAREGNSLTREQYKWLLSSSHSSLRTVIIHVEGVEALLDCSPGLKRLRFVDHPSRNRSSNATYTQLGKVMETCTQLVELTAELISWSIASRARLSLPLWSGSRLGNAVTNIVMRIGKGDGRSYTKQWWLANGCRI
jgi:hypothetical protein